MVALVLVSYKLNIFSEGFRTFRKRHLYSHSGPINCVTALVSKPAALLPHRRGSYGKCARDLPHTPHHRVGSGRKCGPSARLDSLAAFAVHLSPQVFIAKCVAAVVG